MFKKALFIVLAMALAFSFTGCSWNGAAIKISPEGKELIERSVARRVAYSIAQRNPGVVEPAQAYIALVMAVDDATQAPALTEQAGTYLAAKIAPDDPLLAQDLQDLMSFVRVEADYKEQLHRLKFLAAAFAQGLAVK